MQSKEKDQVSFKSDYFQNTGAALCFNGQQKTEQDYLLCCPDQGNFLVFHLADLLNKGDENSNAILAKHMFHFGASSISKDT